MPKLSVIIPTFNRSEFLQKSVSSVLNQTFRNYELIVIDDCSTDDTTEIIENIADKRIRYMRNEVNRGIASVRNMGINNASGEYIAFLDDDDEWISEHKLEKQITLLELCPSDVGLVYTGASSVESSSGEIIRNVVPQYKGYVLNEFILHRFLNMSTLVLRKSCFEKAGLFDESIPFGEDYDMWIRILKEYKVCYINEQLVISKMHLSNLTRDKESVIRGLEIVINKNSGLLASNKKAYTNLLLELGVNYCNNDEIHKARKTFTNCIRTNPLDPRGYFNLLLSLIGSKLFVKVKEFKKNIQP